MFSPKKILVFAMLLPAVLAGNMLLDERPSENNGPWVVVKCPNGKIHYSPPGLLDPQVWASMKSGQNFGKYVTILRDLSCKCDSNALWDADAKCEYAKRNQKWTKHSEARLKKNTNNLSKHTVVTIVDFKGDQVNVRVSNLTFWIKKSWLKLLKTHRCYSNFRPRLPGAPREAVASDGQVLDRKPSAKNGEFILKLTCPWMRTHYFPLPANHKKSVNVMSNAGKFMTILHDLYCACYPNALWNYDARFTQPQKMHHRYSNFRTAEANPLGANPMQMGRTTGPSVQNRMERRLSALPADGTTGVSNARRRLHVLPLTGHRRRQF